MKLFQLNMCDVYMAETMDEAIECAMNETGLNREEVCDEPREIKDEELDRREITLDDGHGTRRTFREQLKIDASTIGSPCMFASTEY